jgi:hypothetical protein
MAQIIYGKVTDESGLGLPGVIVTPTTYMEQQPGEDAAKPIIETSPGGFFMVEIDDRETQLNFYTGFLAGEQPFKTFTIPALAIYPDRWNIRLQLEGPTISAGNAPETTDKKKMNLWPVYAGVGLLALLLIRKMTKKKKRK